jgi:hypothetical protein
LRGHLLPPGQPGGQHRQAAAEGDEGNQSDHRRRRCDRCGTSRQSRRPAQIALAASYPEIDRARVHICLIERDPALLTPFHPALREYTRRQLTGRGVDVRLGTAIAEITPEARGS